MTSIDQETVVDEDTPGKTFEVFLSGTRKTLIGVLVYQVVLCAFGASFFLFTDGPGPSPGGAYWAALAGLFTVSVGLFLLVSRVLSFVREGGARELDGIVEETRLSNSAYGRMLYLIRRYHETEAPQGEEILLGTDLGTLRVKFVPEPRVHGVAPPRKERMRKTRVSGPHGKRR